MLKFNLLTAFVISFYSLREELKVKMNFKKFFEKIKK
nr:bbb20 [Cloning vector 5A4 NP1]